MKKLFVLSVAVLFSMSLLAQKISFTKGDQAPGTLNKPMNYENFIDGFIKAVDENGVVYTFVKADLTVTTKKNKKYSYILTMPHFDERQGNEIASVSYERATYVFTNIRVKNKAGKEFTLADVKYTFVFPFEQ